MQRTSSGTTTNYTRTPDGQAVGLRAAAGQYYVHDHLGSVVGLFTATGSFSGGYSYSPYGEARGTSTNAAVTANSLRYIGGHHDGNGIYKLGARYYDTTLGRFTQTDPSGQEVNPYTYAACNPVNAIDPSGLVSMACTEALIDLYGNLFSAALALAKLVGASASGIGLLLGGLYAVQFILNTTLAAFALGDVLRACR